MSKKLTSSQIDASLGNRTTKIFPRYELDAVKKVINAIGDPYVDAVDGLPLNSQQHRDQMTKEALKVKSTGKADDVQTSILRWVRRNGFPVNGLPVNAVPGGVSPVTSMPLDTLIHGFKWLQWIKALINATSRDASKLPGWLIRPDGETSSTFAPVDLSSFRIPYASDYGHLDLMYPYSMMCTQSCDAGVQAIWEHMVPECGHPLNRVWTSFKDRFIVYRSKEFWQHPDAVELAAKDYLRRAFALQLEHTKQDLEWTRKKDHWTLRPVINVSSAWEAIHLNLRDMFIHEQPVRPCSECPRWIDAGFTCSAACRQARKRRLDKEKG